MKPALAKRRYFLAVMGSALGYIGAVFGVSFIHDKFVDSSVPALLISAIPAVFIALMVWSLWRFLNEVDEVERHELTQAMMSALLVILTLSGGWGLVELFNDDFPRLPIFFVFPLFLLIYGVIASIRYKRCV